MQKRLYSQQSGRPTEDAIGVVIHTYRRKVTEANPKGELKVKIPVYGFIHRDRSRYGKGRMKPGMREIPSNPSDADYRALAAALAKRERKHG